jgi:hypothetical protein
MKLDLQRLPHFVLNCPDSPKRRDFMTAQLERLDIRFEIVPALRTRPKSVGIALSHLRAIHLAAGREPFVILEDDCHLSDDYASVFEVPEKTDALYLGYSRFGLPTIGVAGKGVLDAAVFETDPSGLCRVRNMLARHGIVYVSDRFSKAAVAANHRALRGREHPYPADIEYAVLQASLIVFATPEPLCFQDRRYGGFERATRHPSLSRS